jgi:RTC4-like domain
VSSYGELGSVIIHQTLYNMFPPTSFNLPSIAPLSPEEFMQRILVPEVALRLIMQDRRLLQKGTKGVQEALKVLRESSAYGVAMFPADVTEDGAEGGGGLSGVLGGKKSQRGRKMVEGLEAGERIVMERAMKRRKEIEAEEEEEERVRLAKPRPKPRPVMKGSSKSSMMDVEEEKEEGQGGEKWTGHRSSQSYPMEEDTDPPGDFDVPPPANQEVRRRGRRQRAADADGGSEIEVDSRKSSLERKSRSRASNARSVSPTVTEMNAIAASRDPRKKTARSRASSKASSRASSPKPVRTRRTVPSDDSDSDFQSRPGSKIKQKMEEKEAMAGRAKRPPVRRSSDMDTSSSSEEEKIIPDMTPKKKPQPREESIEVVEENLNMETPRAKRLPAFQASGATPPIEKWRAQFSGAKNGQPALKPTTQRKGQKGVET